MNKLITAKELGEMLIAYGDIPIKLRTYSDGEDCCITLITRDALSLCSHSASGTIYDNIPTVARLDIIIHDNA